MLQGLPKGKGLSGNDLKKKKKRSKAAKSNLIVPPPPTTTTTTTAAATTFLSIDKQHPFSHEVLGIKTFVQLSALLQTSYI